MPVANLAAARPRLSVCAAVSALCAVSWVAVLLDWTRPAAPTGLLLKLLVGWVNLFMERSLLCLPIQIGALMTFGVDLEERMGRHGFTAYIAVVCLLGVPLCAYLLDELVYPPLELTGPWPLVQSVLVGQCYTRGLGAIVWPLPSAMEAAPDGAIDAAVAPLEWRRWLAKVRVRHLPGLLLLFSCITDLNPLGLFDRPDNALCVYLCLCSAVIAWAYLRFSWSKVESVTHFSLLELFKPPPPPRRVEVWLNRVFRTGPSTPSAADGLAPVLFSVPRTGGQVVLPGSTPEEAERRRATALAALARRMKEQQQQQQQSGHDREPDPGETKKDDGDVE